MISLHPLPDFQEHVCPRCHDVLQVTGWYMPGMRMLATLECPTCNRHYFGDLPSGHGLFYPALLDAETGEVFRDIDTWFSQSLAQSYSARHATPVDFKVETLRAVENPVLLNCLDSYYGHSLEKLLNAQHYIQSGVDLIVIVPEFLRWLVPQGVAEIWTVSLPLRQGNQWNDWLAEQFHAHIDAFNQCQLAIAFPELDPQDYGIENFTRVKPFPIDQWKDRSPVITYIWREDRLWYSRSRLKLVRAVQRGGRKLALLKTPLQIQQHA